MKMDKNCFVCLQEVLDPNVFSSHAENAFVLCQVLEVPRLGNDLSRFKRTNYCLPCVKRISNIQNLIEELERLEKEVLEEKHLIELEFRGTTEKLNINTLQSHSQQFRNEILHDLKSNSFQSALGKIRTGQVAKKFCQNPKNLKIKQNLMDNQLLHYNESLPENGVEESDDQLIDEDSEFSPIYQLQCVIDEDQDDDEVQIISPNEIADQQEAFGDEEGENDDTTSSFCEGDIKFEPAGLDDFEDPDPYFDSFEEVSSEAEGEELSFQNNQNAEMTPTNQVRTPLNSKFISSVTHKSFALKDTAPIPVPSSSRNLRDRPHRQSLKKSFPCGSCVESFDTFHEMKAHFQKQHPLKNHGLAPYNCQYCGKTFGQRGHVKDHERIHTGEKPFRCQYCDKAFGHINYVRIHERIHTGEKPYSCKHCGKTFSQRTNATIHERTQHLPHSKNA